MRDTEKAFIAATFRLNAAREEMREAEYNLIRDCVDRREYHAIQLNPAYRRHVFRKNEEMEPDVPAFPSIPVRIA